METSALRPLLKSLCSNSVWNYAVLWKLRHQNPMILSWEDGYFSCPKEGLKEIVSDSTCYKDATDAISPDFEANIWNDNLEDYSAQLLVGDMSSLRYTMGDGVIGEVASTREHSWVSFNDIFSGEVKCPEEWLFQFASGIKTILLVPVLPHGVLQLGSLEEVLEDNDIVTFVKSKFNSISKFLDNTTPFSLKNESAQILSNPEKNSASIPFATSVKSEYLEPASTFELQSGIQSIMNQDLMQLTAQYASIPFGNNLQEAYKYGGENMVDIETLTRMELMESKLLDLSSLMEELQSYSDCYEYNTGFHGESFNRITGCHSIGNFSGETSTGKADLINNSCLKLRKGNEQPNEIFMDSTLLPEDASNTYKNPSERTDLSWFAKGADAGYLLEHVVARSDTGNSFLGQVTAAPIPDKKSNTSSLSSGDSTPWSHGNASNSTLDDFKSMMNTIFREGESDGIKQVQGSKTLKTGKRRAKPGDNQKPRPRDRQLIQDRVKELRELVPNSAKCSIDNLLDRTVNHMLYLRSVADQAEKLRQCTPQELANSKSRCAETSENYSNGTSCAFEVGNKFKLCPIFVEDLDYPGCMLIEMLCNDDGLFLDIAETIRGLELTILKGVQEHRSDNNTWAQFIVEVSKGFHRLDIFWPLMQLLQRKRKPISSRI